MGADARLATTCEPVLPVLPDWPLPVSSGVSTAAVDHEGVEGDVVDAAGGALQTHSLDALAFPGVSRDGSVDGPSLAKRTISLEECAIGTRTFAD